MFGKRIKLFRLFGFEVGIDLSWIVIAVLVVWSLSMGVFPNSYQNLSSQAYWIMGLLGAVGLFLSIIFHEFFHSLVARHHGLPMKGITLFIFGGVAEMSREPPSARAEFNMAAAGPAASIAIGLVFYGIYLLAKRGGWPAPVQGVVGYLATINAILAGFNLLPAFPLDGGRMLRSVLWGMKQDLPWATRVSSRIGAGFGLGLILLGVFQVLQGNFIGGMWWFLIGMFLRGAAQAARKQLLTRQTLEGEPVRRFMKADPVTVSPQLSLQELVEEYVYRYHFKMFPVVEAGALVGCITTKEVRQVPREEWARTRVGDVAQACSPENMIAPETDAVQALSIMNRTGASRLMVTRGGRLVGIIALKDMLDFLSLKVELEQ